MKGLLHFLGPNERPGPRAGDSLAGGPAETGNLHFAYLDYLPPGAVTYLKSGARIAGNTCSYREREAMKSIPPLLKDMGGIGALQFNWYLW